MSSEQLADGVNPLDAELAATWDVLKGYSGRDTDLGIGRRFGGAAAAYSLRDIGAMNGRVVKARRDVDGQGSDPEEDFSANQVQDGTLEKWVNGELESTLPADVDTAAAAYSLRKVKASYSGDAVRIRRTSDSVEVDVAFDSDDKVSASSSVTNTTEQGGESGSTTATDLNGFLNESTENFSATAYADIQASLKEWSSTPTISDTAFSGTNGAGGNSTIPYTLSSQLSISDYTGTKIKVTGKVNTLSGGRLFIKASELNTGGTQYTPPEGVKTIADGTTGNFEYIFTSTGINEFQSVVFLTEVSTTVDVSNIRIQIIEHGATVHTWYDQAGSNNAVQETSANQPKIAANGALLADGLLFDGSDDFLQTSGQVLTNNYTGARSLYGVCKINTDSGYIFGDAANGTDEGTSFYSDTASDKIFFTNGKSGTLTTFDNITTIEGSNFLISSNYNNNNATTIHKNANNNGYTQGTGSYNFSTSSKFTIGDREGGSSAATRLDGSIQEIIAYDSDQSDNRFKIESNINNYYGLYNDANEVTGAFQSADSNSSFSANGKDGFTATSTSSGTDGGGGIELNESVASGDRLYISFNSTKASSSGDGVALRSSLSGGTLKSQNESFAKGFNSFSLLSNGSDADFVIFRDDSGSEFTISDFKVSRIARNGFVETLYDQSGNGRDMVQDTAGYQPRIVRNGGQVKDPSGHKPSVNFGLKGTGQGGLHLKLSSNVPQASSDTLTALFVASLDIDTVTAPRLAAAAIDFNLSSSEVLQSRFGNNRTSTPNLTVSTFDNSFIGFTVNSSLVPKYYLDNSAASTASAHSGTGTPTVFQILGENAIGGDTLDRYHWSGTISEAILYLTDLDSDIEDFKNNINNYYKVF